MVICPSLLGAFLSSLRAQCVPMPAVCSLRATLWLREVHDPSPFRLPSLEVRILLRRLVPPVVHHATGRCPCQWLGRNKGKVASCRSRERHLVKAKRGEVVRQRRLVVGINVQVRLSRADERKQHRVCGAATQHMCAHLSSAPCHALSNSLHRDQTQHSRLCAPLPALALLSCARTGAQLGEALRVKIHLAKPHLPARPKHPQRLGRNLSRR
mmetsp:Transcript_61655/g.169473  ORF Transcript_61655/g.169473 Transcript_61655/m.169473 type:complete len:212 (+) Transcript_61655:178-813(+)